MQWLLEKTELSLFPVEMTRLSSSHTTSKSVGLDIILSRIQVFLDFVTCLLFENQYSIRITGVGLIMMYAMDGMRVFLCNRKTTLIEICCGSGFEKRETQNRAQIRRVLELRNSARYFIHCFGSNFSQAFPMFDQIRVAICNITANSGFTHRYAGAA